MRLLLALFVSLALTVASFSGVATAQASPTPCHEGGAQPPMEKAKACASHCVLQAGALRRALADAAPLVVNLVPASPRTSEDPPPLSGAGPPDTPPPRA
jgi:hypothetical protein